MEDKKLKGKVFYLNHGNGFKGPAEILTQELIDAGIEAEAVDGFLAFGSRFWDKVWRDLWYLSLKHPGALKAHMNIKSTFHLKVYSVIHQIWLAKNIKRWVEKEKPDFVVAAHFAMIIFLPRVLKKYEIPVLGYNSEVVTGNYASISKRIENFFVSSEEGLQKMAELGQPPESLNLIPFPLNPQFRMNFQGQTKEREALGLDDMFTALLSFGGDGAGSTELVNQIAEKKMDIQILAVCGRNQQIKEELDQIKTMNPQLKLVVYGFVDNMHSLLYCSDLSIGKAGMNTSFESIFLKKPIIVTHSYINEEEMVKYLLSYEYGWDCRPGGDNVLDILKRCLDDPKLLPSISRKMGKCPVSFEKGKIAQSLKEATLSFKKNVFRQRPSLFFDMAGTLCDIPIEGQWEKVTLEGIKKVISYLKWGQWLSESELEEMAQGFVFQKAQLRKRAKNEFKEFDIRKQLLDFIDKSIAEHSLPSRPGFTSRELDSMERLFVSTELDITVPFKGITDILKELSEKYDLYCLSNNVSRILVTDILDKIGCRELFKSIYVSVDCGYRKPHSRYLKYVLKSTGLKPSEAVMIGDRLSQDIRFANLCNMRSIYVGIVDHDDNKGQNHENYDMVIEDISELKSLLI